MVSRYRRLADSLKQKLRLSPSSPSGSARFKPTHTGRNERMLEELGGFSQQFRKMQALVDVHRQAVAKTCARSRGFINAQAPKQYTNGPAGSSVVTASQDLSYDSNAVDIMSTLAEQLEEKLHLEITLPIEKWLEALKDAQRQMATLDRARHDADTCKREVLKLESKISAINAPPPASSTRPTLRLPGTAPAPDAPPAPATPTAWNQEQAEQARQRLQRKRAKLDAALQHYEAEEQALNDRLVALASRCSKDLQEYQHQLYRLVSDFYSNTAEVILPTPAGSSKEFLRRAAEKIHATPPASARASPGPPATAPFAAAAPPLPEPAPPSRASSSKLSTAPPDVLIVDHDHSSATRSAPSPAPGPFGGGPFAPRGTAPPSPAPSSQLNSRGGSRDRPPSNLGRGKQPLSIVTPATAAAAAAAATSNGGAASPTSSADQFQSAPARLQPQPNVPLSPVPPAAAAAAGHSDYPPIHQPPSAHSSDASGSPIHPASPANPLAHQHAAARGPGPASRGSEGGSVPSEAEIMQQHQRVTQLMQAAQARAAAGDMQTAAMLQRNAALEAQTLRHNMALQQQAQQQAAAEQAAAGGGDGGSSSRPGTARDSGDAHLRQQQQQAQQQAQAQANAAAAAAAAAAAQQQQQHGQPGQSQQQHGQQGQPQQQHGQHGQPQQPQQQQRGLGPGPVGGAGAGGAGPAAASPSGAMGSGADASGDVGLAMQRQRIHALMEASNAKRREGDVETATKLHQLAMQQAMQLKAAHEQRQQQLLAAQQQQQQQPQHVGAAHGGSEDDDSDTAPDVAGASSRRDAMLLQQQAQARSALAAHQAAAVKQQLLAQQQHQLHIQQHMQHQHQQMHPIAHQQRNVIAAAAAAVARGPRPVHLPEFEFGDDDDDDEADGDTDGSDGWGHEPGAPTYMAPMPGGNAMDSFGPPPPGLQWA